jgi:cellulose synthase/poly-beta-1,6-N-acetylglucosamine synthase-like glycosyltransferase
MAEGETLMLLFLFCFILIIPLFVIATRSVFTFFPESVHPKTFQVKKDFNYTPTVAVIIPCYNEGEAVYTTIKAVWDSDYPKENLKVYPQDDGSVDDSYTWMLKAATDFDRVYPERNPQNLSKTHTYLRAMDRSESEIVINVDSDTIVEPHTIRNLIACLADERLGVVGTPAGLVNGNDSLLTGMQTFNWSLYNQFITNMESAFRANQVIGGFGLAVRRHLLAGIADQIRTRNWFGCSTKDGEDRYITHLILLQGLGSYIEQSATVRTSAMPDYPKFWGQQVRWRRSSYRSSLWVLRTLWFHINHMPMMAIWAILAQLYLSFAAFILVVYFLFAGPLTLLNPIRLITFLGVAIALIIFWDRDMKYQKLRNPFKMLLAIPWVIFSQFYLAVVCLLTLDQDAWGNRDKKQDTKSERNQTNRRTK